MRVIAGKYRSRLLKAPGKLKLRPTSDRLRETLFNVLGPTVQDSLFIDLFAGTGAVGIEAISRGAKRTIFIESHTAAVQLIKQNLIALDAIAGNDLIEADAVKGLERLQRWNIMADFIFHDPPYDNDEAYTRTLEYLDASHLIAPQGIVIVEHWYSFELPEIFNRLERTRVLGQGDTVLSFYRLAAAA
jgi:16S rRNA (guanine(966)-N(2))-methyltransferase RsmD